LSQPNVARVFRRSRRPRLRTLRRLSADARSLHARCPTGSEFVSTLGRRSSAHGRRMARCATRCRTRRPTAATIARRGTHSFRRGTTHVAHSANFARKL